jgi:hypothetical protein
MENEFGRAKKTGLGGHWKSGLGSKILFPQRRIVAFPTKNAFPRGRAKQTKTTEKRWKAWYKSMKSPQNKEGLLA